MGFCNLRAGYRLIRPEYRVMKPHATDSLDTVAIVMWLEELFGASLADGTLGGIFDQLEDQLRGECPNRKAQKILRKLTIATGRPELAERLDEPWRREQIAAIVREVTKDYE